MYEPKTMDYVVVRRLPVPLDQIKDHLMGNDGKNFVLHWALNMRVCPPTILYMEYNPFITCSEQGLKETTVRSQRFYDLEEFSQNVVNPEGYSLHFRHEYYFSADRNGCKVPSLSLINANRIMEPVNSSVPHEYMYEVLVQDYKPKTLQKKHRYTTPQYTERKEAYLKKKYMDLKPSQL